MEEKGEIDLIRSAKMDNSSDPIVSKPLAFPGVPTEGFMDSAQLLFYYVPQLERDISNEERVKESKLQPLFTDCLSALQEALAYSGTLRREEIAVGTELICRGAVYASATHRQIKVCLNYPSIDEIEALHSWFGKIIIETDRGNRIRLAVTDNATADVCHDHRGNDSAQLGRLRAQVDGQDGEAAGDFS
ncbi:unnamed protein product [Oikopleura dioica]|uniref:Uncharacterized protein n=1 Tax=Oikopleura dioica TaxID=34765 RepID=E4Y6I8_OIKDI|nr:unnamed protein product [Oikopleura dioica]